MDVNVEDFKVSANTMVLGDASGDSVTITANTLTAPNGLTIDSAGDIALSADGDNITMDDGTTTVFDFDVANVIFKMMDDSDTGDYFSITTDTHGATTFTTVDDDAAAADLTFTLDGALDVNANQEVAIDSTVASITVGAALADGQTLKLGKNGAVETIIAPHGTAGSELYSVTNTAGTSVGPSAAAIQLTAVAGGVGIRSTANLEGCIQIEADGGADETISIHSDQGTGHGTDAASNASINLISDSGGIALSSGRNGANAIRLAESGGTDGQIHIHADTGLARNSAGNAANASISIYSDGGGIGLYSGNDDTNAIRIEANGGVGETIVVNSNQGTGAGSITLDSDAGGITLSAGSTSHGVKVGTVSSAPVSIGHTTSETSINDNLAVTGSATFNSTVTIDSVGVTAIQTSGESFVDNDTSLMTSAAINDKIEAVVTGEDLDVTTDSGTIAIDLNSETFTIAGTTSEIETSATSNTVTIGLPNNVTVAGDLTVSGGDVAFGNGQNATVAVNATAHGAVGKSLTVSAGTTTAGTTNNIAGGSLTIAGGQGKGTGAGGDIVFKTANATSTGSSLNSLATALTISDDLSATFAGAVVAGTTLGVTGETTFSNNVKIIDDKTLTFGTGDEWTIEYDENGDDDLVLTGSDISVESSTSAKPVLQLLNTNADATGATLKFNKNGASVADGDVIGNLTFVSEDDGGAVHTYASMVGTIDVDAAGEESGKLSFKVATHDGDAPEDGLVLVGGSADSEIDVTIGKGTSSVTSIAGVLDLGDRNITNVGDISLDSISSDGSLVTVNAPCEIANDSSAGATALVLDNDDVDEIALSIEAANTTANVIDVSATSLTTGKALHIDVGNAATTNQATTVTHIDIDKTGVVASGQAVSITGLDLDINDTATNHASAAGIALTGIDLDIVSADATSNTQINTGLDISVTGGDSNYAAIFRAGQVGIGATGPQALLEVEAASTWGNTCLLVDNNSTGQIALKVQASNTTANAVHIEANALLTGSAIDIAADALQGGSILNLASDSSNISSRDLVKIHNDNTAAVGARGLYVLNDAVASTAGETVLIETTVASEGNPLLRLKNSNADANGAILRFENSAAADGSDDDYLGTLSFYGEDDGTPSDTEYAKIEAQAVDVSSGAETGNLIITSMSGSTATEVARTNPESPLANHFCAGLGHKLPVFGVQADRTLTAAMSGMIIVLPAGAARTITLPADTDGVHFKFISMGARAHVVKSTSNNMLGWIRAVNNDTTDAAVDTDQLTGPAGSDGKITFPAGFPGDYLDVVSVNGFWMVQGFMANNATIEAYDA